MNNETFEDEYEYEYDLDESLNTYDWAELGPSLFVYSLTFLAGIVGNVLILTAVVGRGGSGNVAGGSGNNVNNSPVVNVFLASLATADLLLVLICLPLKVKRQGHSIKFEVMTSYFFALTFVKVP